MVPLDIAGIDSAEHIGSGGNADVYRARESDHDRWVAVKVLREADEAAIRRFDRERQAMGRLSGHDGIVTIHRSGLTDAGDPYVVMALCENGSLQDRVVRSGPVEWEEACDLMADVAESVQFAHDNGVVHRDLKPSNILVSPRGRPLVADFGIARIAGGSASMQTTAQSFTPAFSAPEVIDGGESSKSTDIYGLGATLYTLLAGRPPFARGADESVYHVMKRITEEPPASLRDHGVPERVCTVVDAALAKNPSDRPATAGEFARTLRELAAGGGDVSPVAAPVDANATMLHDVQATAPISGDAAPGPTRPDPDTGGSRRAFLIFLSFAAVIALVVALVGLITRGDDRAAPSSPAAPVPTDAPPADPTVAPATTPAPTSTDVVDTTAAPPTSEAGAIVPPSDGGAGRPVAILDTDANNEVDDQFAIAYLLLSDAFTTPGVTVNRTSLGGPIEDHVAEAERVIELVGRSDDVPVFAGATGTFDDIVGRIDQPDYDGRAAVDFIVDTVRAQDGEEVLLLPIGKLTNIALAVASAPDILDDIRILWLGSNYPSSEFSEYNQDNDPEALQFLLDAEVAFEIAVVRIAEPSGTAAVTVTPAEVATNLTGEGPTADPPVAAEDGTLYTTFGDYGVSLFDSVELFGDPPSRSLFDVAAVAVALDPGMADAVVVPAPAFVDGAWVERPDNERRIAIWENFDRDGIVDDLFGTIRASSP